MHPPHDIGVFDSRLFAQMIAQIRQPQRQFQPEQHPFLVGDAKHVLRRHEQAQLDHVEAQFAHAPEFIADFVVSRRRRERFRIPAPTEHPAQMNRFAIEQQALAIRFQPPKAKVRVVVQTTSPSLSSCSVTV